MKFTIISHACLYVEHEDIRLLIDPWIYGSCYWRSWWNYPEPEDKLISKINPTHIYLTHLHWDHYHGPSLRKYYKNDPTIIIPLSSTLRMKKDLDKFFFFKKIIEIPHSKSLHLSKNFKVTSYQWNPLIIDSCLAIEADNKTILNINDCKIFGLSLQHLKWRHPKIDFVLRSHTSASPLPYCIENFNIEKCDRKPIDYAREFTAFCNSTEAKYAIPFASSHYFLRKDTKKYNQFYSNPDYVASIHKEYSIKKNQECIVMPSGCSWSSDTGFSLIDHNYEDINDHIKNGIKLHDYQLQNQEDKENMARLNKKAFIKYFESFLKTIYWPLKLKFNFGYLINEKVSNKLYLCLVKGNKKKLRIIEINKKEDLMQFDLSFIIQCPALIFNDCNLKKLHNTFTPSKILEIKLIDKNAYKNLSKLFSMLDLYENDGLPISKFFTKRQLLNRLLRWRELIDIFIYIFKIKFLKKDILSLYKRN